jgi:hypothetical protein
VASVTPSLPTLRSATHVALDTPTTECLLKLGATNVVRASDILIIGPCRRDVLEHARVRKAWWPLPIPPQEPEEWDRLYSVDIRWEQPVVVWVSGSPADRVNLWRTCSRLRDLGISHRDVFILELERTPRRNPDHDPFGCTDCVADHRDEVLLARLAEARPWPRARYDRAVSLWDRFVDEDLSRFARSCVRGLTGFPELARVWLLVSSFFPRKTSEGTVRLSRFDELLLHRLSAEWETPVTVYARGPEPWEQLICCTGDLFIPERLEHWANHGTDPAVERAAGPKPGTHMLSFVYRLAERGMRLRTRGLEHLADAPPLPIAGTKAYAPGAPWVVLDDGQLARL